MDKIFWPWALMFQEEPDAIAARKSISPQITSDGHWVIDQGNELRGDLHGDESRIEPLHPATRCLRASGRCRELISDRDRRQLHRELRPGWLPRLPVRRRHRWILGTRAKNQAQPRMWRGPPLLKPGLRCRLWGSDRVVQSGLSFFGLIVKQNLQRMLSVWTHILWKLSDG